MGRTSKTEKTIDATAAMFLFVAKMITLGEATQNKTERTLMRSLVHRQKMALFTIEYETRFHPEGIPLNKIARRLEIPLPSASLLVESLVKKGVCCRVTNPNDHRSVHITLTELGQKITKKIILRTTKKMKEIQTGLPPEDIEAFNRVVFHCCAAVWGNQETA